MRQSTIGFLAVATLFAAPLAAQQVSPVSSSIMIGPYAGLNYTTVYGSDASGVDSRTDFAVGGQLDFSLSPNGVLRTGVVYSRRGFKISDQGGTAELKSSYLEVPLLFGYRFPTSGGVRPYLLGGAQVGFKVGCDFAGTSGGQSGSVGCDDIDPSLKFASTDVAGVAGGGLAFPMGINTLTVDLRYALGLQKIEKNTKAKNKGLTLGFGFMVPIGR